MKGDKLNFEVSKASRWSSDVVELGWGETGQHPRGTALSVVSLLQRPVSGCHLRGAAQTPAHSTAAPQPARPGLGRARVLPGPT